MKAETVKAKVLSMKASGKSASEISEYLNAAGARTKTGLKYTPQAIFNIVYAASNKKTKSSYVNEAKSILGREDVQASTNSDILGLLESSKYSDRQKIEAVKALLR